MLIIFSVVAPGLFELYNLLTYLFDLTFSSPIKITRLNFNRFLKETVCIIFKLIFALIGINRAQNFNEKFLNRIADL